MGQVREGMPKETKGANVTQSQALETWINRGIHATCTDCSSHRQFLLSYLCLAAFMVYGSRS
jgi:hypothetical protein